MVIEQKDNSALWQVRATAWELLALSFRYPDKTLADAVASGEWATVVTEIAGALDVPLPSDCTAELSFDEVIYVDGAVAGAPDSENILHVLRVEATRLFVGAPDPAVSPYEGVHRAKVEGVQALLFVNPHSMEVERFMHACGLGRPAGTNEPLDHIATECELLEHLALRVVGAVPVDAGVSDELPGGSASAAYELFLNEHVRVWIPGFAASVQTESHMSFYRRAARLLAAVAG